MTGLFLRIEEVIDQEGRSKVKINLDNLRADNATELEKNVMAVLEPHFIAIAQANLSNVVTLSKTTWPEGS